MGASEPRGPQVTEAPCTINLSCCRPNLQQFYICIDASIDFLYDRVSGCVWTVVCSCDDFIWQQQNMKQKKGNGLKKQWEGTYTCFVMDLYVIQWRWFGCGMLLLLVAVYNFNVGFLVHLSFVIPHIIQSHIWKKGEGVEPGSNIGNSSIKTLQLINRWERRELGSRGAFHGWVKKL